MIMIWKSSLSFIKYCYCIFFMLFGCVLLENCKFGIRGEKNSPSVGGKVMINIICSFEWEIDFASYNE